MIQELFSSNDLMPHGFCYQWQPLLIWLHAISDTLIAIAYFSIPPILIYLVRKKRNIPFDWMFVCFGVFIAACGATHFMEVVTLWIPLYWISGGVKVITALASLPTAFLLARIVPQALNLPRPEDMREANEELKRQAAILKEQAVLLDLSQDAIIVETIAGKILSWNQGAERMYGWPKAEAIGQNKQDLLQTGFPQPREAILEKLLTTGYWEGELQQVRSDGRTIIVSSRWALGRNSDGSPQNILKIDTDITEHGRAEDALRESEDRYRDLVEHSHDLICTHDAAGILLSINEAPLRILGYSRDEMLNKPLRDFVTPETKPLCDAYLVQVQKDGFAKGLLPVLTKSGKQRIWEYDNTLRTEGVATPVVRGMAHDVTDRWVAEKALRKTEERFRQMAENIQEIFWLLDPKTLGALYVSPAFEQICERPLASVSSNPTSYREIIYPDDAERVLTKLAALEKTHQFSEQFRIVCPNSVKWVEVRGFTAKDSAGNVEALVGTAQDITERKRAETALRESEDRYRDLVEHSEDLICTHDLEGRILSLNPAPAKILGYDPAALLNRNIRDFLAPEARGLFADYLTAIKRDGIVEGRLLAVTKTGEERIWEYRNTLRKDLAGNPVVRGMAHDITERKRAEKALRESEEKFSKAFHSNPNAMVIATLKEGRFLDVNRVFEGQFGYMREEVLERTALELGIWQDSPERSEVRSQLREHGFVRDVELRFTGKSGEQRLMMFSAEIIELGGERCVLATAVDITERKRAEGKLLEYEKAVEGVEEMIAVVDREYRYLLANRAFVSYWGMAKEQVVGRLVPDVLDKEFFERIVKQKLDECFEGRVVKYETKYSYPKIGLRDLLISYFPIEGPTGVDRVVSVLRDITEQKRAEDELRRLSGRLLQLQDEERRKIARDLHDSTGQDLVAISTTLSQLRAAFSSQNRKPRKLVAQCRALADRCIRDVRTLSYVLHPPMLDEAGLEDALRHYVEGFAERTEIEVELEVVPNFGRLTREMELGLFRVVQESLVNIQRHSGSFTARISLIRDPEKIVLTVSDRGRGISASKRKGNGTVPLAAGVGIPSMDERVKQIGGRLDIESSGKGTTVRVTIPTRD